MKTYWGSRNIFPCFLNLGTRWTWVVSFTSRPPAKKPPVSNGSNGLGGPHTRSGRGSEEKNFHHCPCREMKPIIVPWPSSYTDWATTALNLFSNTFILCSSSSMKDGVSHPREVNIPQQITVKTIALLLMYSRVWTARDVTGPWYLASRFLPIYIYTWPNVLIIEWTVSLMPLQHSGSAYTPPEFGN